MGLLARLGPLAMLGLSGALVVYPSFNAGGYFAGTPGLVAVALLAVLIVYVLVAESPFAGLRGPVAVAGGALLLFGAWALTSSAWSDAPARALIGFDRALLYVVAIVLFGSLAVGWSSKRMVLRGFALGAFAVSTIGFVTRALPKVWPVGLNTGHSERLSYPLTYWNALGIVAAIGMLLCAHLTSDEREPKIVRVLAAAAIPVLATTLLFTFSRGAIAAFVVGFLVYAIAARSRGLLTGIVSAAPPTALALVVAYNADQLATEHPTAARAVEQGHRVALVVALCAVAAGAVRSMLLGVDERLAVTVLDPARRRSLLGAAGVGVVLALVVSIALGAPAGIGNAYDKFVTGGTKEVRQGDPRKRLTNPDNNGRIDLWTAALKGFHADRLKGSGAGTYQLLWERYRPNAEVANEAHSLYVGVLGELGLVGFGLIVIAIGALMVGLATRIRGPDRTLYAAALAVLVAWGLHTGFDWDWEMPATTLPALGVAAAVLAGARRKRATPSTAGSRFGPLSTPVRVGIALALLVLAVTPALVALSQGPLDKAERAFARGDCRTTVDSALGSLDHLRMRPEPFELLAFCDFRAGANDLALRAVRNAVDSDPRNWRLRYDEALVRGSLGLDPRPAARRALELNPRNQLARAAARRFDTNSVARWQRAARSATLPLSQ